jgi:hypothetical protein
MEPRRLALRYLRNNPAFLALLAADKLGLRRVSGVSACETNLAGPVRVRHVPTPPSDGGTPVDRLVCSWTSWTPRTQMVRCPQNRGNFKQILQAVRFVSDVSACRSGLARAATATLHW